MIDIRKGKTYRYFKSAVTSFLGFCLAKKIVSKDQSIQYFIASFHLGDTLRLLSYIPYFKDYYSADEPYHFQMDGNPYYRKKWTAGRIVVITNQALAGVARLFPCVDEIIVLSDRQLKRLALYAKSDSCVHTNLHRERYDTNSDRENAEVTERLLGVSTYQIVLNLPRPVYLDPEANHLLCLAAKIPEAATERARTLLKEQGASADKTVILVPYSRSSSMLTEEEWRPVIAYFREKGYFLFTNMASNEQALPGTAPLCVPIDVFVAMAGLGCMVTGVQCGATDLIAETQPDLRQIVIHPLLKTPDFKFSRNRGLKAQVEYRNNTCHINLKPDEISGARRIVAEVFSLFEKGVSQREAFKACQGFSSGDAPEARPHRNLNGYIEDLMRTPGLMIFLSASYMASRQDAGFDPSLLGLSPGLAGNTGSATIAVIDTEKGLLCEKTGTGDTLLRLQGKMEDTGALSCAGGEAAPRENIYLLTLFAPRRKREYASYLIMINGTGYSTACEGLTLVVYSRELGHVIDRIHLEPKHENTQLTDGENVNGS